MKKTVFGLFDRYEDAEKAIVQLQELGIDGLEVGLLAIRAEDWSGAGAKGGEKSQSAEDAASGAGIGALVGGVAGILTGLGVIAIPGVGPVVAAGWLASALAGAVAGGVVGTAGGGIVAALIREDVPEREANVYAEGVRRGGTLISARVPEAHVEQVNAVFDRNGCVECQARERDYRASGWTGFDQQAPVYVPGGQ